MIGLPTSLVCEVLSRICTVIGMRDSPYCYMSERDGYVEAAKSLDLRVREAIQTMSLEEQATIKEYLQAWGRDIERRSLSLSRYTGD